MALKITIPVDVSGTDQFSISGIDAVPSTSAFNITGVNTYLTVSKSLTKEGNWLASTTALDTESSNTGFYSHKNLAVGSSGLFEFKGGYLDGVIRDSFGYKLNDSGIKIGFENYADSLKKGPLIISGFQFDDINPADSNSHYGIRLVSRYSILGDGTVKNVGSNTGIDTEGIYTKSPYSAIHDLVLIDAGQGEAFLNIKGRTKGDTGAPQGHNMTVSGIVCHGTNSYVTESSPTLNGIAIRNDSIVLTNFNVTGLDGSGVYTSSGELDNVIVSSGIVEDGDFSNSAVAILCDGHEHRISDVTASVDGASAAYRIQGQTAATSVSLKNGSAEGGLSSVLIKPASDSILLAEIDGMTLRSPSGEFVKTETARPKLLKITNNRLINSPSDPFDLPVAADSIYMSGNDGLSITTTNANTTKFIEIPCAYGTATSVRWRVTASDGVDFFSETVEATYSNIGGTVALIGLATMVHSASSTGAATWLVDANPGTNVVNLRVIGEVAKKINWRVDVTAIG